MARGAAVLAAIVAAAVVLAPAAGADPTRYAPPLSDQRSDVPAIVRYAPPVDGSVLRPFEAPTTAFGPGHRGADLAATGGATVRAAADGRVTFAGRVAGTGWIAIAHADGIVTSYGPVVAPRVARGDRVVRGERIGVLAAGGHGDGDGGLHWGARRGPSYLDPWSLMAAGIPRPTLVGPGRWRPTEPAVTPYEPWGGARWAGLGYHGSPTADAPGFAVAPNANHLVLVAGLGSSSATVPVDPEHLGYDPRSVTSFSYAGRRDARGVPHDPRRDQRPYAPADTWDGVEVAARRLAEQLRAQRRREPGRAVDLVGHSMGGVVIAHYLAHHHDPYDRDLPQIGHVVTIASPLDGSDVASLVTDVHAHRLYGPLLEAGHQRLVRSEGVLGRHVGPLPLDAPAIDDLRVGSPLFDELADGLQDAVDRGAAGPLAMGTRVLTIAGGTDVVVGADRAEMPVTLEEAAPGQTSQHRVLPGDHERVLRTEAVREVVWRFLAGQEVVDSPGRASTGASRVAGHLTRYAGWRLERSDRALAPLLGQTPR